MSDDRAGRPPARDPRAGTGDDGSGQAARRRSRMARMATSRPIAADPVTDDAVGDEVFESAAELFRLLSTPIRLKIISAVCQQEKNVSELLAEIDTTQPNMSQHLSALHQRGVLARRRDGNQIYYKVQSEKVAMLCRAVCTQMAIDLSGESEDDDAERLLPPRSRES